MPNVDPSPVEASTDDSFWPAPRSGHVRVLRHLLAETPQSCPVNPLPVLAAQ